MIIVRLKRMKFRDLLDLPYNEKNGIIELEAILEVLPNTPLEVVKQVYQDHGRNGEHQKEYGELDIGSLAWEKKRITAADIQPCFMLSRFSEWPYRVSQRLDQFEKMGWRCIDVRENVWRHWEEHQTWVMEPVFVHRGLVGTEEGMHLVEGHTRVGVLRGLLSRSLISASSFHGVWYGA